MTRQTSDIRAATCARFDIALAAARSGIPAEMFMPITTEDMFLARDGYWHFRSSCTRVRGNAMLAPWAGPVHRDDGPYEPEKAPCPAHA